MWYESGALPRDRLGDMFIRALISIDITSANWCYLVLSSADKMLRVEQRRCFVLQTFVYVVVVVVMVAYILLTVASLVWFVLGQQEPATRIKLPVLLLGLILATCLLGRVPHTHSR